MAEKSRKALIFIAIAIIILIGIFIQKSKKEFVISGLETMTRTAPTTVNPSSTFTLTYTAVGTSGTWGASIVDSVSGGCKFPDGTNSLRTVMLSSDGNTKPIIITTPASGSCVFTGDYKYGTSPILNFAPLTVTICQSICTRPADLCLASSPDGCGGTCSWTITQNTPADTNCNNVVSREELGVYIDNWIVGSVTRDALGQAIVAWVGGI